MDNVKVAALRDMEYKQLRETYRKVTAQITTKRLRGENTRVMETVAKTLNALLCDRPFASVPSRALMSSGGHGTVGNTHG